MFRFDVNDFALFTGSQNITFYNEIKLCSNHQYFIRKSSERERYHSDLQPSYKKFLYLSK